jgi:hypothetical protein
MRWAATALMLLGSAPAMAQGWRVLMVDGYGTVTTNPSDADQTLAYIDGRGGWRLNFSCHENGRARSFVQLGRRNLFAPPFGSRMRATLQAAARSMDPHGSATLDFEWSRGSYQAEVPLALLHALMEADIAELQGSGGRLSDVFALGSAAPARRVLAPCLRGGAAARPAARQPAAPTAPAPAPAGTSERAGNEPGAWAMTGATAADVFAGLDFVASSPARRFVMTCPNPERSLRAAYPDAPPRFHETNRVGFFRVAAGIGFWPDLPPRSLRDGEARTLTLVAGAVRETLTVRYDPGSVTFEGRVPMDGQLIFAMRSAGSLALQEGTRRLAMLPLAGMAAGIDRALDFCGGGARRIDAVEDPPARALPASAGVSLREQAPGELELRVRAPWAAAPDARPYPATVQFTLYDLDDLATGTVRVLGRFAAEVTVDSAGYRPQLPPFAQLPDRIAVCTRQTRPGDARPMVHLELHGRAPGAAEYRPTARPQVAWSTGEDDCTPALRRAVAAGGRPNRN